MPISQNFSDDFIENQNYFRQRHNIPTLKYSKSLSKDCKKWAEHLFKINDVMHSQPDNIQRQKNTGETIYHRFIKNDNGSGYQLRGKEPVDHWYNQNIDVLLAMMKNSKFSFEKQNSVISTDSGLPQTPQTPLLDLDSQINAYYLQNPKSDFGNITQMLWLNSKKCGVYAGEQNGLYIVVAHYEPGGNIFGQYQQNLKPVASKTKQVLNVMRSVIS